MSENQIIQKNLKKIGEEISHELGAKMVKDFQDAYPNETTANFIGRDILDRILAQPDCEGIRFYYALNESGKKTLVYVGIDKNEQIISKYVGINPAGELVNEKGIVADRAVCPDSQDGWDWWNNSSMSM
jgi:hypothetical protein